MAYEFEFKIDNKFLKFIGRELYSSVPAIVSEMISNALDAKAKNVEIKFNTNPLSLEIIDDGEGMSREDIKELYLNVGYNKREYIKDNREVMGRKGIGKFSVFGLGNKVELYSKKMGFKTTGLLMDYTALVAENGKLSEIVDDTFSTNGTKIVINDFIKKNLNLGVQIYHMKAMIFKSFLPILENGDKSIKVFLDDTEVGMTYSPSDVKNYSDIILEFGTDSEENKKIDDQRSWTDVEKSLKKDVREREVIGPDNIKFREAYKELKNSLLEYGVKEEDCGVNGYLLAVRELKDMSYSSDDEDKKGVKTSYNVISLYSNEKMGQSDILSDVKTATTYDRYLFGKIEANFLDLNYLSDIASSNRASYNKEDDRMIALTKFIKKIVKIVTNSKKKYNKVIANAKIENLIPVKDDFLGTVNDFFKDEDKEKEFTKRFGQSSYQYLRSVKRKEVEQKEKTGEALKKVFISHDSRNKLEGEFIVSVLERLGVQPESILFSSSSNRKQRVEYNINFLKEIDETVRSSRLAIFLLSKEFYDSNMSLAEVGGVLARELTFGVVLCGDFKTEWIADPISTKRINVNFCELLEDDDKALGFFEMAMKQIGYEKTEQEMIDALTAVRAKLKFKKSSFDKTFKPVRRFQLTKKCSICQQMKIVDKNLQMIDCPCGENAWEDGHVINNNRLSKD